MRVSSYESAVLQLGTSHKSVFQSFLQTNQTALTACVQMESVRHALKLQRCPASRLEALVIPHRPTESQALPVVARLLDDVLQLAVTSLTPHASVKRVTRAQTAASVHPGSLLQSHQVRGTGDQAENPVLR